MVKCVILISIGNLHPYIHICCNWPLQPFSLDYGLASHNTHVVRANFTRVWRNLQFDVDFERQIFEKLLSRKTTLHVIMHL